MSLIEKVYYYQSRFQDKRITREDDEASLMIADSICQENIII